MKHVCVLCTSNIFRTSLTRTFPSRTSSTLRDVVDTSAHGGGTEGICLVSCRGQGRMALVPALEQDDTGDTKQVVEMVQRLDHCGSTLQFHSTLNQTWLGKRCITGTATLPFLEVLAWRYVTWFPLGSTFK